MEASDRCPECGTRVTERGVPRPPGWFHWRVVVPLMLVVVALGTMAGLSWQGTMLMGGGPAGQVRAPQFTDPAFALGDVRAIAAGESGRREGELARALLERSNEWLVRPPGNEYLVVMVHPGDATWRRREWYGWPWPVVRRDTSREYMDVRSREPLTREMIDRVVASMKWAPEARVETVWDPPTLMIMKLGGETPFSRETTAVMFAAIGGLALFPMLGWLGAAVAARWVLPARWRTGWRRWGVRVAGACCVAAVVAALSVVPRSAQESISPGSFTVQSLGPSRLGGVESPIVTDVTYEMIAEWSGRAGGDRELAGRLLAAFEDRRPDDDMVLAASFLEDSARSGSFAFVESPWPIAELQTVKRWRLKVTREMAALGVEPRPARDAERVTWPAAPAHWRTWDGSVQVALPRGSPTQELRGLTIYPGGVALVVVLAWMTWLVGRWGCERRARLITRQRVAAGECVVCGYSLKDRGELVTPS